MSAPKVKYKINLNDLFGERLNLNRATREAIGQAIIDKIVERTSEQNIDKFGRSLGSYSESYAKSLDGQVYGKRKGGPVSLLASGDMLGSLTIIEQTPQTITLGFEDRLQNDKAYGHISGMQGHPILDGKVKKRDFLGLPKNELQAIAADFDDRAKAIDAIESAASREDLDKAIVDLIEEIGSEIEGDGG